MSARMKKLHTDSNAYITWHGDKYVIPIKIMQKYKIELPDNDWVTVEEAFADILEKYGEPGCLLQGLRYREGLTQAEFAKQLGITQANLSAMENGRRAIGREMAKRIGKKFKLDYRLFLA